jgi:hypothetical protein
MAITLVPDEAKLTVDLTGAKCDIKAGKQQIFLHGTRGANLAVADNPAGQRRTPSNMINFDGRIFFKGDPKSSADLAEVKKWRFAFVQVADIQAYEFVFVGRMPNEGSTKADFRSVFLAKNPCFDGEPNLDRAFGKAVEGTDLFIDPIAERAGFEVTLMHGDHPNKLMDLQIQNTAAHAPNFIFQAKRDEFFITYLLARDPAKTVHFLARVVWRAAWSGEFKWTDPKQPPTVTMRQSVLNAGTPAIGAPVADDVHFLVAKNPAAPSANTLDKQATDKFILRQDPVVAFSTDRPGDVPADFFP